LAFLIVIFLFAQNSKKTKKKKKKNFEKKFKTSSIDIIFILAMVY